MELWIRSQDKESIRRVNTGLYLKIGLSDYAKGDVWFIVSSGDKLGEYATKERALEILDEIQSKFKNKYLAKVNSILNHADFKKAVQEFEEFNKIDLIGCNGMVDIQPINPEVMVYEMPQE